MENSETLAWGGRMPIIEEMEENNMNPMVKMILTVVVTALVIGCGTYWYVNSKATSDKAALQTTIDGLNTNVTALNKKVADLTPATATTTAATADPKADWKTFSNSTLGISFKYPPEYGDASAKTENGEKGKEIIISFSKNSKLHAGSLTNDFEASRGAANYEIKSFSYAAGKCTYGFAVTKVSVDCDVVKNSKGDSSYQATIESYGDTNTAGYIPVKNNSTYVVLTFDHEDTDTTTKTAIKDILGTFSYL